MGIKRRALLLALVLSAVQQRRHHDVCAFVYSPAGVHVALASTRESSRESTAVIGDSLVQGPT